jgi:ribosomal protein S18 acetylase RimI-like enzyme
MHITPSEENLQLRRVQNNDMPLLQVIYGSTRTQEMDRLIDWTDDMKQSFISQQFMAQHLYYQQNYVGADLWIIEKDNEPIGRLYVHSNFQNREIRIMDISILPEHRGKGIGGRLLQDLQKVAKEMEKPLSIHVEVFNPAKKLYNRLGFKMISETNGVYHLMQWN